jgi:peptide/nickel transport system substrate-binding protein
VVFTYNRSKDPEKSIHSAVVSNVRDVVAEDNHTVRIVLAAPQASFLTKTLERSSGRAMTVVSRGGLEALGEAQYGLTRSAPGRFGPRDTSSGSRSCSSALPATMTLTGPSSIR